MNLFFSLSFTLLSGCNSLQFHVSNETNDEILITTLDGYLRDELVVYNIADMHFGTGAVGSYYIDSVYQVKLRAKSSASIFLNREFIKKNDRSLVQVIVQDKIVVDTIKLNLKSFKAKYNYSFNTSNKFSY